MLLCVCRPDAGQGHALFLGDVAFREGKYHDKIAAEVSPARDEVREERPEGRSTESTAGLLGLAAIGKLFRLESCFQISTRSTGWLWTEIERARLAQHANDVLRRYDDGYS
jgi:hypothetical protein